MSISRSTYNYRKYYVDYKGKGYKKEPERGKNLTTRDISAVVPWGFYKLLKKIKDDYGNPPIIVTENGYSSFEGLDDDERIYYFRTYISAMLDAMDEGCDIRAYTAWSLMDNFEWMQGYSERFGLYEVDYERPERTRTPRKSAYFYKEMVRTCKLDYSIDIDDGH